jgi:transcription elongation factor GreA-like protein
MERANNLMNELKDDSLVKAIVVLITNQGSNWAGIYR